MYSWQTNNTSVVQSRSSYTPKECMKQTDSERKRVSCPWYVTSAAIQMQLSFAFPSCPSHQLTWREWEKMVYEHKKVSRVTSSHWRYPLFFQSKFHWELYESCSPYPAQRNVIEIHTTSWNVHINTYLYHLSNVGNVRTSITDVVIWLCLSGETSSKMHSTWTSLDCLHIQ